MQSDASCLPGELRRPLTIAHAIRKSDRAIGYAEHALMATACAMFGVMMVMISADAIGRYFFNSPLSFVYDFVLRYALPSAFFLAFSRTFRVGGHIAVEFVARRLPARLHQSIIELLFALSAVIMWAITALGVATTYRSWLAGEATSGIHHWLIWPSEMLVPLGMGVLALRITHAAAANIVAGLNDMPVLAYPGESAEADLASPMSHEPKIPEESTS